MIFFDYDFNLVLLKKYNYTRDLDFYRSLYYSIFQRDMKQPDFTKHIQDFITKNTHTTKLTNNN
jgi:hypothetical protein